MKIQMAEQNLTVKYADVVSEKFVKKIAPTEFKAFIDTCAKASKRTKESIVDYFARCLEAGGMGRGWDISQAPEVLNAWHNLETKFEKETGLGLCMGFNNVTGYFFCVGGVWEETKAGEKFEKDIDRKFFVSCEQKEED